MKLFRSWSRPELVEAIKFLETNLAAGVQSSNIITQGAIAYSSPENGFTILRSLYARLDEADGKQVEKNGPRLIRQRISGGAF